jgi:uroporphyrin-III C-methyltransferase
MDSLPFPMPVFEPGTVWLVGAGPGDPGLMTLQALHAIRSADIVVYDALVDPRALDAARPGTEIVFAGKRGGRPSQRQPDISVTLIEHARRGLRVARLKGGDPFVFGRGGEEALALVEAGIPFRVVPGVTAGVAAPAYAGIPLTYRHSNASVAFVTGHGADGGTPSSADWTALARLAEVLVVYMPLGHLGEIARRLIDGGRPAAEPVALIASATLPQQRVVTATLEEAAAAAERAGIAPPVLLVVGEVVRLRDRLDWLGRPGR